jgi:hypothetical protein
MVDKLVLEQYLLDTLKQNKELFDLVVNKQYILYGEYLGTLLVNKVMQLNYSLPKPTLLRLDPTNKTNGYSEVIEYPTYVISITSNIGLLDSCTNFNSCFITSTDVVISDSFVELLNTKQLEIVNINPLSKALAELVYLADRYKGYLYANITKAIAMAKDISRLMASPECSLITSNTNAGILKTLTDIEIKWVTLDVYKDSLVPLVVLPEVSLLPDNISKYSKSHLAHDDTLSQCYLALANCLYGNGVKKSARENKLIVLEYPELYPYVVSNLSYTDNLPNNWKAKLPYLNKLLAEHNVRLFFNKLNLAEQIQLLDELRGLIKQYGLWVIGLLEQQSKYDKKELVKLIEFKKLENSKWLVPPFKLPEIFPFGLHKTWKIVELNTRQLLIHEGEYQGHCVGGYSVSPAHRIFSLRKDKLRYTLEIYYDTYKHKWITGQERGKHNSLLESIEPITQQELRIIIPWLLSVLPRVTVSPSTTSNDYIYF